MKVMEGVGTTVVPLHKVYGMGRDYYASIAYSISVQGVGGVNGCDYYASIALLSIWRGWDFYMCMLPLHYIVSWRGSWLGLLCFHCVLNLWEGLGLLCFHCIECRGGGCWTTMLPLD